MGVLIIQILSSGSHLGEYTEPITVLFVLDMLSKILFSRIHFWTISSSLFKMEVRSAGFFADACIVVSLLSRCTISTYLDVVSVSY